MRINLDTSCVKDYAKFLRVKALPKYRITGRTVDFPDEYAGALGFDVEIAEQQAYSPPAWMFDYQAAICRIAVGQARMLGEVVDWDGLADRVNLSRAVGPMLDPTAYRAAMDRLGPMEEVLRAVGALVRAERAFREVCERTEAQCEAVRKGGYA